MAKFCDEVGYAEPSETVPGVWMDVIVEHKLFGDVLRNTMQVTEAEMKVNPDLTLGNSLSLVADAYAREHYSAIRYVKWMGVRWSVTRVEVKHPRLILQLGGVYNGPTPSAPDPA